MAAETPSCIVMNNVQGTTVNLGRFILHPRSPLLSRTALERWMHLVLSQVTALDVVVERLYSKSLESTLVDRALPLCLE